MFLFAFIVFNIAATFKMFTYINHNYFNSNLTTFLKVSLSTMKVTFVVCSYQIANNA